MTQRLFFRLEGTVHAIFTAILALTKTIPKEFYWAVSPRWNVTPRCGAEMVVVFVVGLVADPEVGPAADPEGGQRLTRWRTETSKRIIRIAAAKTGISWK